MKSVQANATIKRSDRVTLIFVQIKFKPKLVRSRKGYFIWNEVKIDQGAIVILNICSPSTRVPSFIKGTLLDLKITDWLQHNTSRWCQQLTLSKKKKSFRQKLNRSTILLNDKRNQIKPRNIDNLSSKQQKNKHSLQQLIEVSQRSTTF